MSTSLLVTKLFIPHARPKLVSRPRLVERINEGLHRKLTLISAPAGFGKTTLVMEWLMGVGEHSSSNWIGWFSIDETDNDPIRFFTYFCAALNRASGLEQKLCDDVMTLMDTPSPPPAEAVVSMVINEIALIEEKIILVVDDFHLIENKEIISSITYLLENQPENFHLLITTREDPFLPLSRLRARDQLTEIRAVDLRFNADEVNKFLIDVMDLHLSNEEYKALEIRTEGWITGLQLAAISLRGQKDTRNFIDRFSGSNRLVLDYLIEEVITQQTDEIQNFLLKTSILNRLSGSLCNAVAEVQNGQSLLELLDHSNLFIIPLDEQRGWYRYHHLFADLLRQMLNRTAKDQLFSLHLKASEWYIQNGFSDQAIEHLFKAEDYDRAVHLIEEQADDCWTHGEHLKLQYWLEELPEDLVLSKPNLCVFQAWEQYANGQQDAVEKTLQAVEKLDLSEVVSNETLRMRIQGRIAAIRAFLVTDKGELGAIKHYAQEALEYLPEDDIYWRNAAYIPLGDVLYLSGHVDDAAQIRLETWETSKAIGNFYMEIFASMKYCITLRQQGEFDRIKEICQQQMILAEKKGLSILPLAGWIQSEWGEALAEQGDLDQAIKRTREGAKQAKGGHVGMYQWCNLRLITALFSNHYFEDIEAIFQEVEGYAGDQLPPWILTEMKARQLRLWLAQGKIEETSQWLVEQGLEVEGKPDRNNEWKYLALVRYLIATEHPTDTLDLLKRLYLNANDRGHISRVIEILNLQALAMYAIGDNSHAMNVLEQSLNLAAPRGFLYTYINEGPPMARLLYEALSKDIAPDYVQKLLGAFPSAEPEMKQESDKQTRLEGLIEPLTDRELDVLQLIATGLSRQEIADELIVSLNTIKTHARNIFQKLGVNSQTQAVAKARGLGLIDS